VCDHGKAISTIRVKEKEVVQYYKTNLQGMEETLKSGVLGQDIEGNVVDFSNIEG
jgi:hypothetical protein